MFRYPGFIIDGIKSVFKRFYLSNCQLQVLFKHELGDEVVQKYLRAKESVKKEDHKTDVCTKK